MTKRENKPKKVEGLEFGDIKSLARTLGYTTEMVRLTLVGERNNAHIIRAAQELVNQRKNLKAFAKP